MNNSAATQTLRQIADRAQAAVLADTEHAHLCQRELVQAQNRLAASRQHLAKTHRALYQSIRLDEIRLCGSARTSDCSHTGVGGCAAPGQATACRQAAPAAQR